MENNELKEFRAESHAFAARHLKECATEIIEWQDTAVLRDGRVRELAALCGKFIANHDQLRVAESMINRAAIDAVAAPAQVEPSGALPELPFGTDNLARLMRNLEDTSYNEGSEALACRLSDCRTVIAELLADRSSRGQQAKQAIEARGGALSDAEILLMGANLEPFQNATFRALHGQTMTHPERQDYDALMLYTRAIEARILGQQGGGDAADAASVAAVLGQQAVKDAARYRFLRNAPSWGNEIYDALGYGDEKDFDAAVDAAIQAQAGDAKGGA